MYPLAPATGTLTFIRRPDAGLALRILEFLPGAGLAVLLPLPHPRIAGEEAGLLQRQPQLVVERQEGPRRPGPGARAPPPAGARPGPRPSPAGRCRRISSLQPCRSFSGSGFWDAWGCSGPRYTFSFLAIARPRRPFGSMPWTAHSITRSG